MRLKSLHTWVVETVSHTEVFWLKVQLSGPAFRRGMALIAYQTRLSLLGSPTTSFLRAFILF